MFPHLRGTFSHYIESRASVLVIMFTSEPHMSAIFHIACHLSWENIQKDW